jgi:hypothetical protein
MLAGLQSLLAVALLAAPALAQQAPTAPLVLRLPGGTRAAGLGNTFAAGRGAEVLFYNPAQIGLTRGTAISLARFGSAATLGTLSTVGPFGKVSIGAGVQYLDYETPPGPDFFIRPALLPVGSSLPSSSLAAGMAVSTRIKGIRVGVGAKYVQERVGLLADGGLAFDVGLAREVGRATVGFAVQNLGSGFDVLHINRASLPTRMSLAVASPTILLGTYFDLLATAGVSRERDGRMVPSAGVELVYQPLDGWSFVGRIGARRVEDGPAPLESPVTLGGSFGLDRLWLDYSFQPSRGVGATHRIGIRIQ